MLGVASNRDACLSGLTALTLSDVSCVRGHRMLFRALNLRVGAGSLLAVEGSNGAGKTSLLRMIAGFLAPAAGSIAISTQDRVHQDSEERSRLVGWLGHLDAAKSQATPRQVLSFFMSLYGSSDRADKLLERVGLGRLADLPCQYLSAGQKKRLALGRLIGSSRPVWLLDEPLAGLDQSGKYLLREFIGAHCAAGGIAVAATHEPLGLDGSSIKLDALAS